MLRSSELHGALDALRAIGEVSGSADTFARAGLECLPRLVRSELTTLSVCDLQTGHRRVLSDQPGAISKREIEVFDRHFHDHPLVREHGRNPRAVTRRIGELLSEGQFRRTPLYNDYYRVIGINHVMAVPIHVDARLLVSFVLNRSGYGFSDRDREVLELMRPLLGNLYRLSTTALSPTPALTPELTPREREVLSWVAAGKTDRDIASILGMSPRTVHKHLQHVYEKLGVETRTAAVMRARAVGCGYSGLRTRSIISG
jgi:DNA-binding CsgD family transcriptional regulator